MIIVNAHVYLDTLVLFAKLKTKSFVTMDQIIKLVNIMELLFTITMLVNANACLVI